jgi:hypothetical protein
MFFFGAFAPETTQSLEIRKFLKDGTLPADELIDSPCEGECSRCGREIKEGDKIVVASYCYTAPRNPFIVYAKNIIAPPARWTIGYRVFCSDCAKDGQWEGAKKDLKKKIDDTKEAIRKVFG